MEYKTGYYWAYRKGDPILQPVYYHDGFVYEVVIRKYHPNHGPEDGVELVDLEIEDLLEGKWQLTDPVRFVMEE